MYNLFIIQVISFPSGKIFLNTKKKIIMDTPPSNKCYKDIINGGRDMCETMKKSL